MGIVVVPIAFIFLIIELVVFYYTITELDPSMSMKERARRDISQKEYIAFVFTALIIPSFVILLLIHLHVYFQSPTNSKICIQPLGVALIYIVYVTPILTLIALFSKYIVKTSYKLFYLGLANAAFLYPLLISILGRAVVKVMSEIFYGGNLKTCFIP